MKWDGGGGGGGVDEREGVFFGFPVMAATLA